MQAIRVHHAGGPEVMWLEALPTPEPKPGQALVTISTSGVNYIDLRQRSGDLPCELPITLGREGVGTVTALGPGTAVEGVTVGTRVAWALEQGSYATHAVVPAEALVPLPDAIDDQTAAAVMLQGLTAHAFTSSAFPTKAGDTCLVHAAAGGLGGLLTQLATARGARVIGTVSTRGKVEAALRAGATNVIVRSEERVPDAVRELTDSRGVDVVYDGIGRDTFEDGLESLRPLGYMILFGQASGPVPPLDTHVLARHGGRFLTHAMVGQYVTDRTQLIKRATELFTWITTGRVKVTPGLTFPLAEAAAAHVAIGSGVTTGKLLLTVT